MIIQPLHAFHATIDFSDVLAEIFDLFWGAKLAKITKSGWRIPGGVTTAG
jgi:hypothetical protein